MPVYTVHAPSAHAADFRATDKFVFVRDGFHFWAMVLGPLWLIWQRLWLALIGWLVLVIGLEVAVASLRGGRLGVTAVGAIIAVLMGLEGVDPTTIGPQLPPVLLGGRAGSEERGASPAPAAPAQAAEAAPAGGAQRQEPAALLVEHPIRSGQSVVFPLGEVTVLGSVASGAEIVAGGSIHVYGTLRGRAMAGVNGNSAARIYCQKIEAELLAIDGYYQTAEELDAALRDRPAQAWLEGSIMRITPLN